MKTPHKWANEIHAFADGTTIEAISMASAISMAAGTWHIDSDPDWGNEFMCFRIKPEVKLPEFPLAFTTFTGSLQAIVVVYGERCYEAGYKAARDEI